MHVQPMFQRREATFPRRFLFDTFRAGSAREGRSVAEALFRDGLCLPSGTAMSDADLERVTGVVRQVGTR